MPALSEMILGNRQRTSKIDSLVKISALRPKLTVLASVEIA
ncbi:hypothetical protein [Microcoleus sp. EPA2]